MNAILEKLFKKRGIKDVSELDKDEQVTFKEYQRILSRPELSMKDLKEFMAARIAQIEAKWQDQNTTAEKKAELIPYHTVYKILLNAVSAPQLEREALERALLTHLE